MGILIDGLTFFCAAIYTAQLPNVGHHESEEEFSLREALNGITVVVNNATLLLGFAATLVVNVLCFPIFLVVAPYAISQRFSEDMWGYCLAASGFGACIGSVITVLASGHERLVGLAVTCGLFLAGAMALLGLGTSAWMAILGRRSSASSKPPGSPAGQLPCRHIPRRRIWARSWRSIPS